MYFRDKRNGYIGETLNPVLIEMYLNNTEIYEVIDKGEKAPATKKPGRKPTTTKKQ